MISVSETHPVMSQAVSIEYMTRTIRNVHAAAG